MSSNINRSEGVNEKTIPPPEEFIKHNIGRKVIVKLQNEEEYKGILIALDGTMNIYLQDTDEIINGKVENHFENLFIRGNNRKLYIMVYHLF